MEDGPCGLPGRARLKLQKLFERGQPVARAGSWVVTECDPLQLTNVLGAPGSWRLVLASGLPLDCLRDLRKPLVELTRDARTVAEEIARLPAPIDESALIEDRDCSSAWVTGGSVPDGARCKTGAAPGGRS